MNVQNQNEQFNMRNVIRRSLLVTLLLMVGSTGFAATPQRRPPNIILILVDDLGWRDIGFAGNDFVETPNVDALASRGVVFTQSYASAPNCAPTRACLLSGLYTPRHGVYTVVDPGQPPGSPWQKLQAADSKAELATSFVTIAESLRDGGYTTGFFGMWNLGRGRTGAVTPGGQGFQTVVFPEDLGFAKDAYFDGKGNYLSDRLTDEVGRFIELNRKHPFFVYLADHAVHAPFDAKPDLVMKYEEKRKRSNDRRDDPAYAATIEAVDQNVGRIERMLDRLSLQDDTLIVFTSDNGATPQYTAPLRGSKGELYEGGIRVPLVVAGAGVSRHGTSCETPVASIDIYPTLLDLAGLPAPAGQLLDGVSLKPVLTSSAALPERQLFWHFPCYVGRATPSSAVRRGDYKLIEFFEDGGRQRLFNLRNDPDESRDLTKTEPELKDSLYRALRAWQKSTGAICPIEANPNFDASVSRPRGGSR